MRHVTTPAHAHRDVNGNVTLLIDSKTKKCRIGIFVTSSIQTIQIMNQIVEACDLGAQ